MPTDVLMPQMGESITEGTITKWLKKPGDTVQRDEPLFEISTDKVDAEIPSPSAGTLKEIKIAEGATVQINTVVATIEEGGSASAPAKVETAATPSSDTATPSAVDAPAATQGNPAAADVAAAGTKIESGVGTEVLMPQMGESITEGTITKWLKKVGDTVQRDEPIFEISTDKVDAEIPSPIAGPRARPSASTPLLLSSVEARRHLRPSPRHQPLRQRRPALHPHHPLRQPLLRQASARVPRHWSARSPLRTTSISRPSPALEPPAASQSRTSLDTLAVAVQYSPQHLPLPRSLRLPPLPPTLRCPASSCRCRRCAPSSPSEWSSPSRPARTSTPSSRWT
jgi:biotin carboxyl carrier protein